MSGSTVNIQAAGKVVAADNPLPVTSTGGMVQVSAEVVIGTGATYANGQVAGPDVGADKTILGCARVGAGTGKILKARLITNNVLMIDSLAQFRVHLYDDAAGVVTAINNSAANTLLYANGAHRVGSIDFNQFITAGAGSDAAVSYGVHQSGNSAFTPFKCAAAATAMSCRIETLAAVTLVTGQKFTLFLMIEQD